MQVENLPINPIDAPIRPRFGKIECSGLRYVLTLCVFDAKVNVFLFKRLHNSPSNQSTKATVYRALSHVFAIFAFTASSPAEVHPAIHFQKSSVSSWYGLSPTFTPALKARNPLMVGEPSRSGDGVPALDPFCCVLTA
jgi:hypothetical protein